jgi:hypothetical protein
MRYFLFILVTFTLFLRPAEVVPELKDQPIYEVLILICLAASCPQVLRQLTTGSLAACPITACVVGILGVVVLSGLYNISALEAAEGGFTFFKVMVYYLLLVAVMDSPARLRNFLYTLGILILALTVLALLQYHEVIQIEALASYAEKQENDIDAATGESGALLLRLCSTGIFHNPNDLSRVLVVGIVISLYGLGDRNGKLPRLSWVAPLAVFGYALSLTHSRGGFLALLGSLAVLGGLRLGKWKLIAAGGLLLPLLFVLAAGRQTNLTTTEGTGQQRIRLWSDGLEAFKESPVLGIGMDGYPNIAGKYVAHNSFVHCYTELGFLGGTLFAAAFYLALWVPYRHASWQARIQNRELLRARPYVTAIIAGYVAGMLSSSRSYSQLTYLLLALGTVYCRLAADRLSAPLARLDLSLVRRVTVISAILLALTYLFVRISFAQSVK